MLSQVIQAQTLCCGTKNIVRKVVLTTMVDDATLPVVNWFDVDKEGLAKLLDRFGRHRVVGELVSNALDTNTREIRVYLDPVPNSPRVRVRVVDDDPDGFKDLSHAWTLFAESDRKDSPTKRGRFNLGEKIALALCDHAVITTTTGGVEFGHDGRRRLRRKRERGSEFDATMRLTRADLDEARDLVRAIIVPSAVKLYLDDVLLPRRKVVRQFYAQLPTVIADDDGVLRTTARNTVVWLYEPSEGETASIYEMGIPVVELAGGDKWHIDVGQKVPLSFDRDNVTPRYLERLRAAVLNETHDLLDKASAGESWVADARGAPEIEAGAYAASIVTQHGDDAVMNDPSDLEGTKISMSQGRRVIYGNQLTPAERANRKRFGKDGFVVLPPAGQITPSPKPYSDDPDAPMAEFLAEEDWTEPMRWVAGHAQTLAVELLDSNLSVCINITSSNFAAAYCPGELTFALKSLGRKFFERAATTESGLDRLHHLLIHEFGHHYASDHLSSDYHEALCRLGASLGRLMRDRPDMFSLS